MSDQIDGDETPDVKGWKVEAQNFQQKMFLLLGDREWDEWDKSDQDILWRKVRFGLYGLSETNSKENKSEVVELIADTILKIAESGNKIHFACIFIFGKRENDRFYVPVFKVKGKQDQILFIDSECHVYENWQNYLNYNHLPEGLFCYPLDGLYQANEDKVVLVDFCRSPACDPQIKNLNNYETISKLMSSLWIDTPIQATTQLTSADTESCNTTQSVEDQQLHDQACTGPNVSEAGVNLLTIISNLSKSVQKSMHENIIQAAAAGEVATRAEEIAYDVVTLTVNGIESLRNILLLIDKKKKGTLTDDDVLNFETSVLFFTNNLIEGNMARKLIEDTQQEVLKQHCDDLTPSQIDQLSKLLKFSKGNTQLQRNANNIKAINRNIDKLTFYESLVTVKNDLEGHQVGFSSEEPGVININNELHIAPNKFVEISIMDRLEILEATIKVKAEGGIDKEYRNKIEKILSKYRVVMQWQRDKEIEFLKQAFNTENLDSIKIDGKEIFKNMKPYELDRLFNSITEAGNERSKILEITNQFATMRKCKKPRDYIDYVEFVAKYISKLKKDVSTDYLEALKDAKKRGITCGKVLHEMGFKNKKDLLNQVFDEFLTNPEESFKALEEKYLDVEKNVLPLNAKMDPKFVSETSAVYHFYKHSDFNKRTLTEEEYFALASELVNEPLNKRSAQLNQPGDTVMIMFTNPVNGARAIVLEKLIDGTQSLATVFYDKKVFNQSN